MSQSSSIDKRYLDAAIYIGYQLIADAIVSDGCYNWQAYSVHPIHPEKRIPTLTNLSGAFYEGLSGIAFFFGLLYKETVNDDFKNAAYGILKTIDQQGFCDSKVESLSLYSGSEGMIFVWYHLSIVFDDEVLKQKALSMLQLRTSTLIKGVPDVLSGAPGMLAFLINVQKIETVDGLQRLINRIAEHIVSTANYSERGISWETIEGDEHLLGYAHGTSGFVHALTELYEYSGDNQFLEIAVQAIKYEDSFFDDKRKNWPDFRKDDQHQGLAFMSAWCHGAPGILLPRIKLYSMTRNQSLLPKIALATEQLIANNHSSADASISFCLCHGLAGNSEVFIQLYHYLKDSRALREAQQIADFGIEKYIANDLEFPSGTLQQKRSRSLLLGDAGVGVFYLRMFNLKNPSPLFITGNDINSAREHAAPAFSG